MCGKREAPCCARPQRCGENDAVSLCSGAPARLSGAHPGGRHRGAYTFGAGTGAPDRLYPANPWRGLCILRAGNGSYGHNTQHIPLFCAQRKGNGRSFGGAGTAGHRTSCGTKLFPPFRRRTTACAGRACTCAAGVYACDGRANCRVWIMATKRLCSRAQARLPGKDIL